MIGAGAGGQRKIIVQIAVEPPGDCQPEVCPKAEGLCVQRLKYLQVWIINGQQAKGDLKLPRFNVGRRIEIRLDREAVGDVGFANLNVTPMRNVRCVLCKKLQVNISPGYFVVRDVVLNV